MEKIKVVGRKKYGDLSIYFSFFKFEDIHDTLINLFAKLGINEKSLREIDIIFDNINEDFYYFFNEKYRINIFVAKEKIHLFITPKNEIYKRELIQLIREEFEY